MNRDFILQRRMDSSNSYCFLFKQRANILSITKYTTFLHWYKYNCWSWIKSPFWTWGVLYNYSTDIEDHKMPLLFGILFQVSKCPFFGCSNISYTRQAYFKAPLNHSKWPKTSLNRTKPSLLSICLVIFWVGS